MSDFIGKRRKEWESRLSKRLAFLSEQISEVKKEEYLNGVTEEDYNDFYNYYIQINMEIEKYFFKKYEKHEDYNFESEELDIQELLGFMEERFEKLYAVLKNNFSLRLSTFICDMNNKVYDWFKIMKENHSNIRVCIDDEEAALVQELVLKYYEMAELNNFITSHEEYTTICTIYEYAGYLKIMENVITENLMTIIGAVRILDRLNDNLDEIPEIKDQSLKNAIIDFLVNLGFSTEILQQIK